jgi:hypothetical protein
MSQSRTRPPVPINILAPLFQAHFALLGGPVRSCSTVDSSILGDTRVFLDGQISDQHDRRGAFERKSGHRHLDFMPARIIGEVNAQNRTGLARRCRCSAPGRAVCRRRRSPRGDCRQERLWRSGHFSCLAAFAHSPPIWALAAECGEQSAAVENRSALSVEALAPLGSDDL